MNPIFSQMNDSNTMCVFHAPDLDGWMSCAVAVQAGIAKDDCSNVWWWSYGDLDPDALAARFAESGGGQLDYILTGDISIPESAVFAFNLYGIKVVTTDHHVSAIRTYAARKCEGSESLYVSSAEEDPNLAAVSEVFWIGRNDCESKPFKEHSYNYAFFPKEGETISGALLLWLAINGRNGKEIPEVLEIVSAWDAWDLNSNWRESGVLLNAAMVSRMDRACLKMDRIEARVRLVKDDLLEMLKHPTDAYEAIKEGRLIQEHNEGQWARTARNAYTIHWEGCRLLCLNARGSSLVAKTVYDPEQHEGIVMWGINKEGKVAVSFYNEHVTDASPDFSEIAKKYGGGGHKGAAGCVMSKIPPEFLIPVE